MEAAELVALLRPMLRGALVAVDFDGTLSAIVADPMTARPVDGALPALRELSGHGAAIAVITGRDALTVVELGGLADVPGIEVHGLYGAERWHDGELSSLPTPASMTALRERLPELVAQRATAPGVWVEDKRLSLVVHARTSPDPERALDPLRRPVGELADGLGLEVHPGRGVLEVRLPGYDKGTALRALAARRPGAAVLFAGDDRGDVPAFEAVRELRAAGRPAWSLAAQAPEVPAEVSGQADVTVDGPAGVVQLLAALSSPSS
jgi:trehalose 6-phosphate phosphatase